MGKIEMRYDEEGRPIGRHDERGRLIWGTCPTCGEEVSAERSGLSYVCARGCGTVLFETCGTCRSPVATRAPDGGELVPCPHVHKRHSASGAVWAHWPWSTLRDDEELIEEGKP